MFGQFLSNLLAPDPQPLPGEDCRLALAALLVRVARADRTYSEAEMDRITRILQARYGLGPFEASALRAQAETLEEQAPDTVRFTRAIKDAVPLEERMGVIEALEAVALADGKRDDNEDALLRLIAPLLGINDRDSNLARLKVQGEA